MRASPAGARQGRDGLPKATPAPAPTNSSQLPGHPRRRGWAERAGAFTGYTYAEAHTCARLLSRRYRRSSPPAKGSVHANTGGLLRVASLRERELVGKEDVLGVITDHLNKGVSVGGHRASVATEGRALPRRRLLKSLVQAFELRGIGFALNSGVACQGAIDESRRRAA